MGDSLDNDLSYLCYDIVQDIHKESEATYMALDIKLAGQLALGTCTRNSMCTMITWVTFWVLSTIDSQNNEN